ncbi:MAG: LPS-assembly protein LptD [Gammaproteobacteria bacterium]
MITGQALPATLLHRLAALVAIVLIGCLPYVQAEDVPYESADRDSRLPPSLDIELSTLEQLEKMGEVEISADKATLRADDTSQFEGDVQITRDGGTIQADMARYDPKAEQFSVEGNVRYDDEAIDIDASDARFDSAQELGEFSDASFALKNGDGRGDAKRISVEGDRYLELDDVRYSACPAGENDWRLIANKIRVDRERDIGEGRGVRVEFKGVPILYTPFLSFPASGARKTGFLLPDYGNTDRSGNDLSVPFYWNIAPNYDATITSRYLTARGAQLGIEGRYMLPNTEGAIETVYLADDMRANRDRYLGSWRHDSYFDNGIRVHADITDVSDRNYFGDLSSSLAGTAITHLERLLEVELIRENWMLGMRMQSFQTLDNEITEANEPYKRVPQMVFGGRWDTGLGTQTSIDAELSHFERDAGARGQRFSIEPTFSLPLQTPGASLIPSVRVNHTQYRLDDLNPLAETEPTRTVPIYSLDGRLIFERDTGHGGRFLHTFEPRMRYTHIPFVDQSDVPIFDTGFPDFNLVQLFQDNRYRGTDRIGDTDKLAVGFTTRLFDTNNGREVVTATLGQALFLSRRNVQLPGREVVGDNASNLIAEIGVNLSSRWNGNLEYQWEPESRETSKAALRLQYRPADNKVINLGYRFQDNDLEQTDISFAWPVGSHWNLVGRWNYSLDENITLERFAGIEYERCCWAVRLVSRSYVNNVDGGTDKALFAQFELKGLTSIGTRVDAFLERGILGYGNVNR